MTSTSLVILAQMNGHTAPTDHSDTLQPYEARLARDIHHKTHKLFIKPVGGLANRIRVMNSGYLLAQKLELQPIVLWERNPDLNAPFNLLFDPIEGMEVIDLKPGWQWKSLRPYYFPDKRPKGKAALFYRLCQSTHDIRGEVWYDDLQRIFQALKNHYVPQVAKNMDSIAQMALPQVSNLLHKKLSGQNAYVSSSWTLTEETALAIRIYPIEILRHKIEAIGIDSNQIGLHIRRTDHDWAKQYSGTERFVTAIQREMVANENIRFFLSTDSPEVARDLQAKFPGRIEHIHHDTIQRDSTTGIQAAVIDLFCLSRCTRIFGSFMSSFSDIAGAIGGIEVKPII